MKTQLYIYDFEIELDEEVQFLLNKQFEDLSNPAEIINDWSKTVSIPFTEKNNKTFGYIYNPNRVIASDGTETSYTRMGIYFDPTKKLDFRLVYDSFVLMEGYAKMNDIKMTNNNGTYNITLYGTLGKIFQEMKKITFNLESENEDYIIDCSQYWKSSISAQTVAASCNDTISRTHTLTNNWQNYIGYILNNSFDSDFDYSCFENASGARKIEDVLNDNEFYETTGIQPDQVLENGGLLPRSFGEFRSYLQVPYLYMEKLWLLFQTKAEEITGYTFDLDSDWFNTSNPYWWNLCIMLMRKDVNRGISYNNRYNGFRDYTGGTGETESLGQWSANAAATVISGGLHITSVVSEEMPGILVHPTASENKLVFGDNNSISAKFYFRSFLSVITQGLHINDTNGLILEITATGQSGATQTQAFFYRREGGSATYSGATYIDVPDSASTSYYIILPTAEAYFNFPKNEFGEYITFSWRAYWKNNSWPFAGASAQGDFQYYLGGARMGGQPIGNSSQLDIKVLDDKWSRSGGSFVLNDLWNNDYNIFDQILTYCKVFDLKWLVDNFEKKIYIKTRQNYFADYTVTDWTDKVDKSKDFTIKPITFDTKYVLFNYADDDNQLNKDYKDYFGVNYGEYRLITDYNFNLETTKLFSKPFKPSIIYSDTLLNYVTLVNGTINYITQNELFVFNRDKDKKFKDIFGCYFFYTGKGTIQTGSLRGCVITDDSAAQAFNSTYYYTGRSVQPASTITTYNCLSNVYNSKLCLFSKPKKNYTYDSTLFNNTQSIYELFWEKYLNERYNIQNKIVTCHLVLTPKDWIDFQFNKFIIIDGILYMVNKIYDYNIESPESTKVDLISITNITSYTE